MRRTAPLETAVLPPAAAAELLGKARDVYIDALAQTRDHDRALLAVYLSGAVMG